MTHITRVLSALAVSLFLFPGVTHAASTKGGYPACLTEELFDQMMQAVVSKDQAGRQYLLENGCIMLRAGVRASLLGSTWGKAQIRVYSGDTAMVLWTNIEAVILR